MTTLGAAIDENIIEMIFPFRRWLVNERASTDIILTYPVYQECFRPGTGRVNSLVPGKYAFNFRCVIFKHVLVIDILGTSFAIYLQCMPQDHIDDVTLVQVMVLSNHTTPHYLNQC